MESDSDYSDEALVTDDENDSDECEGGWADDSDDEPVPVKVKRFLFKGKHYLREIVGSGGSGRLQVFDEETQRPIGYYEVDAMYPLGRILFTDSDEYRASLPPLTFVKMEDGTRYVPGQGSPREQQIKAQQNVAEKAAALAKRHPNRVYENMTYEEFDRLGGAYSKPDSLGFRTQRRWIMMQDFDVDAFDTSSLEYESKAKVTGSAIRKGAVLSLTTFDDPIDLFLESQNTQVLKQQTPLSGIVGGAPKAKAPKAKAPKAKAPTESNFSKMKVAEHNAYGNAMLD